MIKKICTKCGEEKSVDDFYKHPKIKSGYNPECKKCHGLLTAKWQRENKDKVSARNRRWYLKNPETRKAIQTLYREQNKTKISEKAKLDYQRYIKERRRTPKEIYRTYKNRAKQQGRVFNATYEQFTELLNQPCVYCGDTASGIDRVDNEKGYTLDNMAPCCYKCNWMKRDLTKAEFFTHLEQIRRWAVIEYNVNIPLPNEVDSVSSRAA